MNKFSLKHHLITLLGSLVFVTVLSLLLGGMEEGGWFDALISAINIPV